MTSYARRLTVAGLLVGIALAPATRAEQPVAPAAPVAVSAVDQSPISLGLLPVQAKEANAQTTKFRGLIESALDKQSAGLSKVDVIDRGRIDKVLEELACSRLGRTDLQAGQIVGAEVLLAAVLSQDSGGLTVQLSAVETATGNVLREQQAPLGDEAAVEPAVRTFLAGLPAACVRKPHRIDVALLPITHTSPFPSPGGLAEDLRQRLAGKLEAVPGVRVLHRELGQFVLVESQLAAVGLVDAKRRFAPVAGTVTIQGNLKQEVADGKPLEQSVLTLELKVRGGGKEQVVRVTGSLAEAATMELAAARGLCEIVGGLAGASGKVEVALDDQDRRMWEAQTYLALARPLVHLGEWKDPANQRACELVTKAAALLPESPEPYEITDMLGYIEFSSTGLQGRGGLTPLSAIRQRFIAGFPRHRLWTHAAMVQQYHLLGAAIVLPIKDNELRTLIATQGQEHYQEALGLAQRMAEGVIAGRCYPGEATDLKPSIRLLLLEGQYDKALRMCVAAARPLQLCGWSPFNTYVIYAIELHQLDWAFKAAQYQRELYPGYPVQWLDVHGHMATLQADPHFDRWAPILAEAHAQATRVAQKEAARQLPAWDGTHLADRQPIADLEKHAAPGGAVMAISSQGGPAVAVLRAGNQYLLWKVGAEAPVVLDGLPSLVPPGQIMGYVMRPSLATFEGRVYIGAEDLGLFAADPASGKTARVGGGFPEGSVHALAAEGKCLYAAGGGKEAGFIARREAGQESWKVWLAPKGCGPVRRIVASNEGPWRIYHAGSQRISVFDPQGGTWKEGCAAEKYCFAADAMAGAAGGILLFDTDTYTQHPMYLVTESDKAMLSIHFPPGGMSVFSPILDRHATLWNEKAFTEATLAPLVDHPVDVAVVDGCFWILDSAGGLTATRDGRSFAGPFMVADHGSALCLTADALVVASQTSVSIVPRKLLAEKLGQAGAFHESREIVATATARLKTWLDSQPPARQAAYFSQLRRPDLAAKVATTGPAIEPVAAAATAVDWASQLCEAKQYDEALRVLTPLLGDPQKPMDEEVAYGYLVALRGAKKWDTIRDLAPRLWKQTALGTNVQVMCRQNMYFAAMQATVSEQEFEQLLWDHVTGRLPVVPWRWDQNPVSEYLRWEVRANAAEWLREYLTQHGRLREIEGNPLIPAP